MSSNKPSVVSTGRGGSGNIGSSSSAGAGPADLKTPHLKQPLFTTGRGGSGNMMINHPDLPEVTRAAQDADHAPQRSESWQKPGTSITTGRGGGGNMVSQQSYSAAERARADDTGGGGGGAGGNVIEGRAVDREGNDGASRAAAVSGGGGGSSSSGGGNDGERQGRRSTFVEGAMGMLSKVRGSSKSKDRGDRGKRKSED